MNILKLTDRRHLLIIALCAAILPYTGCKKITQGVSGTVTECYGDWMPGAYHPHGIRPYPCKVFFLQAEGAHFDSLTYGWNYFCANDMDESVLTVVATNRQGRYAVSLDEGCYLAGAFLGDTIAIFCQLTGDVTSDNRTVHVYPDQVTQCDIRVNHAVY